MDWSYPLRAACERHPRRVALRHRGAEVSFAELEARVAALAAGLADRGLAGETVAWMLPNAPDAIVVAMALARIGAVAVPLNDRLTDGELAFIRQDAGVALTLDAATLPAFVAGGPPTDDRAWPVADDAPATIIYTSGTTGAPKGVVRSHRANAWNVVNSALGSPRAPGDVELFNLPAFGIGLLHFALPALLGGATVVLDDAFDARRVWALLDGSDVTRTFLAPTMMSAMLDADPGADTSSLTTIYTAYELADGLRARVLERFGDVFVYMYGLTEAQLTCTAPGAFTAKPGSVGGAMGALRIRIVDPTSGRPLPAGEVGEIALHGPAVMDGYHRRPEETAAVLRDGWVHTGDLGALDADGDLHYRGRLKEMIKTGGFSVDPREVERVLAAQPGVAGAAVVGVPDDHWGEMVVAFVEPAPAPSASPEHALDPAALRAACRRDLAGYKVPKQVRVLAALPLNATGKVARGELRALATTPTDR